MSRQHKSKGNCNKTQRVATNKPKAKTFAAPVAAAAAAAKQKRATEQELKRVVKRAREQVSERTQHKMCVQAAK